VVVIDDGSSIAPTIPAFADGLDVSVHVQEDRGYGLARARNLGARFASGEILIFVDCDMIAERQHVEAHARWHHTVSNAVVSGFRWHADFSSCDPSDVAGAVAAHDVSRLVVGQTPQRPEWIEHHLSRTDMMSGAFDDLFLVTSGGNLSIRQELYLDVGGNDESFSQWGGEDNEFGFRVVQAGAVVIPERQAVCWHQGEGYEHSPEEVRSLLVQTPKMKNLIAELGYREPQAGCSYTVPYGVVTVDGRSVPAEVTIRTVESVLGSRFHDLIVVVTAPFDLYEAKWLSRRFVSDRRVHIVQDPSELDDANRFSPLRVDVPPGALFHEATMDQIVNRVKASGVGILYVTLPETDVSVAMLSAMSTRAANRARRIATTPEEIEPLIGQLFGERWVSGRTLGLGMIHDSDGLTEPVDPLAAEEAVIQSTTDAEVIASMENRNATLENDNAALRSRRALRLADSAGSLRAARTRQQAVLAFDALWKAIRGVDS
jgi:hypothetical protein